jgi:hypothetical protein
MSHSTLGQGGSAATRDPNVARKVVHERS